MDTTNYEQFECDQSKIEKQVVWMKEGANYEIIFWEDTLITVEIDNFVDISVKDTDPGLKGDTATNTFKPAILENGIDADGDGKINLQSSTRDALFSAAKMLTSLGWKANELWLQEVNLTKEIDWFETGTDRIKTVREWKSLGVSGKYTDLPEASENASLILPQGRQGPKFLAYSNFNVFFEWNKSFIYVLTAAHFANQLEGSPSFTPGNPEKGLTKNQMKLLQTKLKKLGYEVGEIDGILGSKTRRSVQEIQRVLNQPADAWPTIELLELLLNA